MAKSNGLWVTFDGGALNGPIKYKFEGHQLISRKGFPWPRCKHCGLVFLKNKMTKWCIDKGCGAVYHPQYKATIKRLTTQRW